LADSSFPLVLLALHAVQGYWYAGLLMAILFSLFGVQAIDPAAKGWSHPLFRLVIIPGVSLFWPLLLVRWVRHQGPPQERNAHRLAVRP
jgi:hypothetical protein